MFIFDHTGYLPTTYTIPPTPTWMSVPLFPYSLATHYPPLGPLIQNERHVCAPKQQQIWTICCRDGTDDFCSLKGMTSMVTCDKESPCTSMIPKRGTGLGGFGNNKAHGKTLLCHRVHEGGLMQISCKTVRCLPAEMEMVLIDDVRVA